MSANRYSLNTWFRGILLASLILCIGCTSHSPAPVVDSPGQFSITSPTDLARPTSAAPSSVNGDAFEAMWPNQLVTTGAPNNVTFEPDWDSASPDPAGLAYAIYRVGTPEASATYTINFDWEAPTPSYADLWIGIADFTAGAWDWHSGPPANSISFSSTKHIQLGDAWVVVACTGSDAWTLDRLWMEAQSAPTWTSVGNFANLGSGAGGATYSAEYHNTDPNIILVGQDVGGLFKTTDGGASWRHVNQGGITMPGATAGNYGITGIFASPHNDNVFFAASWARLFRSDDVGETWTNLVPAPLFDPDEIEIAFSWVEFSPTDPNLVVAGTGDWHSPDYGLGLYRSTDAGLSFQPADATGIAEDAVYGSLEFSPDGLTLFAATSDGLFKSINQGDSFTKITSIFRHDHGHWFGIGGSGPNIRYWYVLHTLGEDGNLGNWNGGVYKSINGTDWTEITGAPLEYEEDTFELMRPQGAVLHPSDPDTLYLNLRSNGFQGGTYRYDTAWAEITSSWVNETYEQDEYTSPEGLAISKSHPNNMISLHDVVSLQTIDGGATWWQSNTVAVGDRWQGTGAELTDVYDLEVSQGVFYAALEDTGLWRSDDRGQTWKQIWWYFNDVGERVDPDNDAATQIAAHPDNADRIYFLASTWSIGVRESFTAKIYKSIDGGTNNTELTSPFTLGKRSRPAMAVVWGATPAQDVLYAAAHGDSIYKSTDGGANWDEMSTGISAEDKMLVFSIAVDPGNPDEVYAGMSSWFKEFSGAGGLYRSDNGGANWNKVASFPHQDVGHLGFAGSPPRLFAHGWTLSDGTGFSTGSLMVSNDGTTFTPVLNQPYVFDVIDAPGFPGTLITASSSTYYPGEGQDAGVYVSTDNGDTWDKLAGNLLHSWTMNMAIFPDEPNRLYLATYGAGIAACDLQ